MGFLKNTIVLKVDPAKPDKDAIDYAACAVRAGCLVAFPTETVYGIAANPADRRAIRDLYKVKRRPRGKPFTVHISDLKMMRLFGCAPAGRTRAIIRKFWPGPLTAIVRSRSGKKVGFRMPANRVALELIKASGAPIVAPSANLSGNNPPTSAAGVLKELDGRIDILLDAGRTRIGIESTVVDFTVMPPKILREGAIRAEKILRAYRDA